MDHVVSKLHSLQARPGPARPWLVTGLLLLLTTAGLDAQPSPARPNVVLILMDDLGYGDLGSYGAPDLKTPALDRLAADGIRFTDFYANAPVCTPTRTGLMTGRYQQRYGLERPLSASGDHLDVGLRPTGRTLPQLMKNAGYATALVGKWHLGWRPEFHPNRHGFDYFWGYLAGYIDWWTHVSSDGRPDLWRNGEPATYAGFFDDGVTEQAVRFIGEHAATPFFLEVAFGSPHWPFLSPAAPPAVPVAPGAMFQQPSGANPPTRRDYVAIVEHADANIAKILAAIERARLTANTMVIFTSDNGGEWLSRNAPFFHRKDSVWEGGIRVPAIVRWPAGLPSGRTTPQVAITMDLTRTILGAARADLPSDLEGIDLLPLLGAAPPPGGGLARTLFWRVSTPTLQQRAVRSGDFKYVLDDAKQMLFDLRTDPGERHDLSSSRQDLVRNLREKLLAWEKEVGGR
jgi:arylsulfatase A-like enzyme